jgi:EAL domain-containing protein (putative c-di-GMP-specific phosphodiesterase class I)
MKASQRSVTRCRRCGAEPDPADDRPSGQRRTNVNNLDGSASLDARFTEALDLMWIAFQPIVSWRTKRVVGYEALVRSADAVLSNPREILETAERLGRLQELGRAIRDRVAEEAPQAPRGAQIFVNLHAADLNDEQLYLADTAFARIANHVVLEITERASLEIVPEVERRMKRLRDCGFKIAVDDLGVGYAGLTSFTLLEPEFVKFDVSLIHADPTKQSIIRSMKTLCDELGVLVVAEGVETSRERDTLVGLGCDLLQGFLFARPERGFSVPNWSGVALSLSPG